MSTYIGSRYHIPPFIPNPEIFCGYGIFPKNGTWRLCKNSSKYIFSNKKTGHVKFIYTNISIGVVCQQK